MFNFDGLLSYISPESFICTMSSYNGTCLSTTWRHGTERSNDRLQLLVFSSTTVECIARRCWRRIQGVWGKLWIRRSIVNPHVAMAIGEISSNRKIHSPAKHARKFWQQHNPATDFNVCEISWDRWPFVSEVTKLSRNKAFNFNNPKFVCWKSEYVNIRE